MDAVFKLLLLLLFFVCMFLAGSKIYVFLNTKIKESKSGFQILLFSLLMLAAFAGLFFGGFYVLIEVYGFLALNK